MKEPQNNRGNTTSQPKDTSEGSDSANARLRRSFWQAAQVAIVQKENGFRDKFERYVAKDHHNADLRRKAMTAITAKMARVAHAVIKSGCELPAFFEGRVPGGRTSSGTGREGIPKMTL